MAIKYRNALGHTVSPLSQEVKYIDGGGKTGIPVIVTLDANNNYINTPIQSIPNLSITRTGKGKTLKEVYNWQIFDQQVHNNELNSPQIWKVIEERQDEKVGPNARIQKNIEREAELSNKNFEFSLLIQTKFGYGEEKQKEIFDLFNRANKEILRLNDITGGDIGIIFRHDYFHFTSDRIELKILAAEEVVSGRYLENKADEYKNKLIEVYTEIIKEQSFLDELINSINSITPIQLWNLQKNLGIEGTAWALESQERQEGYNQIIENAKFLQRQIAKAETYVT